MVFWSFNVSFLSTIACQAPMVHACNPSYSGGRDQEDCSWKPAQILCNILFGKYPTQNRAEDMAQVVEGLPSKQEALHSNSSIMKKQKNGLSSSFPPKFLIHFSFRSQKLAGLWRTWMYLKSMKPLQLFLLQLLKNLD
jgi:hypothetical protein